MILHLAKDMPEAVGKLDAVKGLPWPVVQSHGEAIIGLIAEVKRRDPSELPGRVSDEESVRDRVAIDAAWSAAQVICLAAGVDPGLVSGRRDIARAWFIHRRGGDPASLFTGWRREVLGEPLADLLAGRGTVDVRWHDAALRPATGD